MRENAPRALRPEPAARADPAAPPVPPAGSAPSAAVVTERPGAPPYG